MITTVPRPHRGAGRRVYPGFLQVAGFMGLGPRRHVDAFRGLFGDIASGRDAEALRTQEFYEEYFAVLDVTAEYYLDTVRAVFKDHDMANGRFRWRDRLHRPGRIDTALLTIEAENDELCRPGQTEAAQRLCTGIPEARKQHHLQPGVGHYGVFSGSRFEARDLPRDPRLRGRLRLTRHDQDLDVIVRALERAEGVRHAFQSDPGGDDRVGVDLAGGDRLQDGLQRVEAAVGGERDADLLGDGHDRGDRVVLHQPADLEDVRVPGRLVEELVEHALAAGRVEHDRRQRAAGRLVGIDP